MSDRVHRTVRPTLPEGYQYGDAKKRTLAEMMAMDVDAFLAVYGIEGLARISPRTAWQQFGYIRAGSSPITMADGSSLSDCFQRRAPDPFQAYDMDSRKCDHGWHYYVGDAAVCECRERTRPR